MHRTLILYKNDELPFSLYISGTSYGYKKTDGTFVAFRGDSTATYTFSSGNGSTVDLGARNNYRYVNATNVYNEGMANRGNITPSGITLISSPATVNIGDILVYMCYASPQIIETNLTINGVTLIDRVTNGNTDMRIYQTTTTSVSFSLQYPTFSMICKLDY